jgi:cytoskeleton protein RodZ
MDETELDDVVTVGQRLKEAREAKGLSVEDVAAQTRIPTRHLTSLEESDWDKLPAATYSVGFAKNYAGVVGLDRTEIGDLLKAEMGGRLAAAIHPEVYEAVDPARTMPKGLVIGALILLALVVLALSWLSNRSMQTEEPVADANAVAPPAASAAVPAAAPAPAASGPVVLTATEPVWLEIKDGTRVLKQGQMAPGESYQIPAGAVAPLLTTGKPEALRIAVGTSPAPAIGEPGKRVSSVSLAAADLLSGRAPAPANTAATPTQPQPRAAARPVPRQSNAPGAAATPPSSPEANGAAPATTE